MSNIRNWYKRIHQYIAYTLARGEHLEEELDAIQSSFEKIPELNDDGTEFTETFGIKKPTQDNHPVQYGQIKHIEQQLANIDSNAQITSEQAQTAIQYGQAAKDIAVNLIKPDGYKYIGRCKSIAELRTIKPTYHGQRILVDAYYEGGTTGGGEFVADLQDLDTPDDGGICIVGNWGSRWKRIFFDHVDIMWFGAVNNIDCSAHLINALRYNNIKIGTGEWIANINEQNKVILENIEKLHIAGQLNFHVSGKLTLRETIQNKISQQISIIGDDCINTSIKSQVNVTGSKGAYYVTLLMSNIDGVEPGDYLHTINIDKGAEIHRGCWEILSVNQSDKTIIVKNTAQVDTFPVTNISTSESYVIKTTLNFINCDGIFCISGNIYINNIMIVGNSDDYWSKNDIEKTEKGTHGIIVGAVTISKIDNSNLQGLSGGHVSSGRFVGVSGFDQQGVVVELGGTFYGDFISSCNNKRRGFYASTAAGIRAKHISANGNYLDGIICDIGGQVYASSYSCAVGNGDRGIIASSTGSIIFDKGICSYNKIGAESRSCGFIQITSGQIYNNSIGIYAQYTGSVFCDHSLLQNNETGIHALLSSTVRANNCELSNDIDYISYDNAIIVCTGSNADRSKILLRNGGAIIDDLFNITDSLNTKKLSLKNINESGVILSTTSLGDDLVLTFQSEMKEYKPGYHFRGNTNGFYPQLDNSNQLGRQNNRWADIYAVNTVIQSSDERLKQHISSLNNDIVKAWNEVNICQYKWIDAIDKKGNGARYHIGLIAQKIKDVFEKHGINAFEYGLLCYDKWDEENEILDEEGNVIQEYRPAGDRWGIRAEECLFLEAECNRRKVNELESRLQVLEAKYG